MRCRKCAPASRGGSPRGEPPRAALDRLDPLWSHEGAVRFNEFLQALGSIPPATLTQRLNDLEAAGVLERVVIDSRPPRTEYRLSERGRALRSLMNALTRFAETA